MSDMIHFKKLSIVHGDIRIDMDLKKYSGYAKRAQWWLGEQVLQSSRAVMPMRTGSLQQRSHTEDGGRQVIFPGPYARYLYMGKVMVDAVTGRGPRKIPTGPNEYVLRFRKGAKLRPTNRRLTYSRSEAVDHWFDAAKERDLQIWLDGVRDILLTGRVG